MERLAGKVAVITGGAGAIGLAAAQTFVGEGARVLLVDLDEAALERASREIDGGVSSHLAADVTDPNDTQRYMQTAIERYGGIDILLNNAGILGAVSPITEYPVDVFDRVMAVNVRGVWLGLKYGMPAIAKRGGGSIIITSSTAGYRGSSGLSAYVTSKHAVIGMMRVAALEGASLGVRVNTVNPASLDTPMMRDLEEGFAPGAITQAREVFTAKIPLKRYGTARDVASIMLFLASDESRFCTGGVYPVDGGRSAT